MNRSLRRALMDLVSISIADGFHSLLLCEFPASYQVIASSSHGETLNRRIQYEHIDPESMHTHVMLNN